MWQEAEVLLENCRDKVAPLCVLEGYSPSNLGDSESRALRNASIGLLDQ